MRYSKIIFIRYIPLTKKIYQDFYFNEISSLGIYVEYWDISSLYFEKKYFNESIEFKNVLIKHFSSFKELELAIVNNDLTRTLFIPIVTLEGRVYRLYSIFNKFKCKVAIFGRNMLPIVNVRLHFYDNIKRIGWKSLLNKFNSYRLKFLFNKKDFQGFSIIFQGGKYGIYGIGTIFPKILNNEVLIINSDDYDRYLSISKELSEKNYVVFLDEYIPFHSDLDVCGLNHINPQTYYNSLNTLFDAIEIRFKTKVVIAAHPKAEKYLTNNYFDGREVVFNKTPELVRDSRFVIAHDSTSINYAVCFNKPILFLNTNDIEAQLPMTSANIINFADYLGQEVINANDGNLSELIEIYNPKIEEYKYHKWLLDFLTWENTKDKISWSIIESWLRK